MGNGDQASIYHAFLYTSSGKEVLASWLMRLWPPITAGMRDTGVHISPQIEFDSRIYYAQRRSECLCKWNICLNEEPQRPLS